MAREVGVAVNVGRTKSTAKTAKRPIARHARLDISQRAGPRGEKSSRVRRARRAPMVLSAGLQVSRQSVRQEHTCCWVNVSHVVRITSTRTTGRVCARHAEQDTTPAEEGQMEIRVANAFHVPQVVSALTAAPPKLRALRAPTLLLANINALFVVTTTGTQQEQERPIRVQSAHQVSKRQAVLSLPTPGARSVRRAPRATVPAQAVYVPRVSSQG